MNIGDDGRDIDQELAGIATRAGLGNIRFAEVKRFAEALRDRLEKAADELDNDPSAACGNYRAAATPICDVVFGKGRPAGCRHGFDSRKCAVCHRYTDEEVRESLGEWGWRPGRGPRNIAELKLQVRRLEADLAKCYRLSGADPDGAPDSMLANDAVDEVRRLREEYDALEAEKVKAEKDQAALHGLAHSAAFAFRILGIEPMERKTLRAAIERAGFQMDAEGWLPGDSAYRPEADPE